MTSIEWSEPAANDLRRLIDYVRNQHSLNIASRRLEQIARAVDQLLVWPHYGHPVSYLDLRVLYVRHAKCRVYYAIRRGGSIVIVRLEAEMELQKFTEDDQKAA